MQYLVPTRIETPRLLLRCFKQQDWHDIHHYYADEIAAKYTRGKVLNEGESWRIMACMIGHWQIHQYGPYAIEDKQTQQVIGVTGFWYPGEWPEPEIKWGLIRQYWGLGYASEAARAVLAAAEKFIPQTSLISLIHSENKASIQLALALGAVLEKTIDFKNTECHIYRHKTKGDK